VVNAHNAIVMLGALKAGVLTIVRVHVFVINHAAVRYPQVGQVIVDFWNILEDHAGRYGL
jgi:hypothetical protein